jgi:hypothetical protein
MIGKVERLKPELRLQPISDSKSPEKTKIEISVSRPTKGIKTWGAEARGCYWSERGGIKIAQGWTMCAVDYNILLDLVSQLRTSRRIERGQGQSRDLIDQDIGDSFAELLARGCGEEQEEESRKQRGEGFMRPPN